MSEEKDEILDKMINETNRLDRIANEIRVNCAIEERLKENPNWKPYWQKEKEAEEE